tara:strand:- start:1833 stop:2468 length:636 start_codon:yes stop_codon:yes gene_type:complete
MIYLKDMGLKNGLDSTKYKKALDFSYNFYRKKSRKGQRFPYFTFLSSVSNLIIENNGTTDEAIAGLFHDILEDETGIRKQSLIKNKFGVKVLNIVKQCSNSPNQLNNKDDWLINKKEFLESMQKKSQSSLLVSICDKFHSSSCIIADYNKMGKKIWKDYNISPEDLNWYYKSLCKNFKKCLKNHKNLKDRFQRNVNELEYFCKKKIESQKS